MIKEVISNNFNLNINKEIEAPPSLVEKEVLSNSFNLVINKGDIIPPQQIEGLDEAIKDYTAKLEHIRKCIQIANEKISKNVFDLKTHEDIFNKLTDNGKKKAIIMENGELYINATYVKSGLLEGCILRTSPNGLGQHVYVEGDMYSIKDGVDTKAMFGFKSPITGQKSNIPFLAIGHDGIGYSYNYMTGVSYPAIYNPIGSDYAYSEWAYQFAKDNYTSIRFTSNGEIEINPDYRLSVGRYYQAGKRRELASVFEKNGEGCVGTYAVEVINVLTKYLRSSDTLYLESNNGDIGLVLYGGSEKAFQPQDQLNGQVQLGTPWGAWKNVFTSSSYSSEGIFIDDAVEYSEPISFSEDVLDRINFISTMRNGSTNLHMDVTAIKDTDYVKCSDKSDDVYVNQGELLKLALFEIKKLKLEIEKLKIKEKEEAQNESI